MIEVGVLIAQANRLEPLPSSAVRLTTLVSRPNTALQELVDVISFDQVLTLKLLRAANSAASGSAMRVATVDEAVCRLGGARVASLAVAFAVKPRFQQALPGYSLKQGQLWQHSVASALAAEVLPSVCHVALPPESFTAALLHDVGKLVLHRFLSPDLLGAIQRAQSKGLSHVEAEIKVLQAHHGQIGGIVAQNWNLPESIVKAVVYHHQPLAVGDPICDIVCLANWVAKKVEAALAQTHCELPPPPIVCERIGLSSADLEELCLRTAQRYHEVSQCYGVD